MELTQVNSSNIIAVGYDDGKLFIKFTNGTYMYEGVRPEVYKALVEAKSAGGFFYSMIRNRYRTTKLTEEL